MVLENRSETRYTPKLLGKLTRLRNQPGRSIRDGRKTMNNRIKLWDLPTRIFHWCLVALIGVSWFSGENEIMWLHFYAGYGIMALILFRVMWGFIGSSNTRFISFIRPPGEVIGYLRQFLKRNGKVTLGITRWAGSRCWRCCSAPW